MSRLVPQLRTELTLMLRNGEQVLLTLGIPVLLLVFFSLVDVLPTGTPDPIDFLAPGVLALAVMSSAISPLRGLSSAQKPDCASQSELHTS